MSTFSHYVNRDMIHLYATRAVKACILTFKFTRLQLANESPAFALSRAHRAIKTLRGRSPRVEAAARITNLNGHVARVAESRGEARPTLHRTRCFIFKSRALCIYSYTLRPAKYFTRGNSRAKINDERSLVGWRDGEIRIIKLCGKFLNTTYARGFIAPIARILFDFSTR